MVAEAVYPYLTPLIRSTLAVPVPPEAGILVMKLGDWLVILVVKQLDVVAGVA